MQRLVFLALFLSLLVSCDTGGSADNDKLDARVSVLERKMKELEPKRAGAPNLADRVTALEKGGGAIGKIKSNSGGTGGDETAASKLYAEADRAVADGRIDEARVKVKELLASHGSTKAARNGRRLQNELNIVGRAVSNPEVEKWFTDSAGGVDFNQGTTFVIFWEVWCPHCRREAPKVQAVYEKWKGKLKVVGLTQVNKSATDQGVADFIKENKISYPIGKEDGSASRAFGINGIPAAAAVKNGEVIWRGHPARVSDQLIEKWLASS